MRVIQTGPPMPRDVGGPVPVQAGTAVVEGTVVSADYGRPVRRATVRLSSPSGPPLIVTADDGGRFRFEGVPAGEFLLTASKPGYLESTFGQRQPGSGRPGTAIAIADGQRIERLSLSLARGGVLAGTVADDGGEPAYGTVVQAFRSEWQRGERTWRMAGSDRADDRGSFRIGALPPGDYLVVATPAGEVPNPEQLSVAGPMPGVVMSRMVRPAGMTNAGAGNTDAAPPTGYAPVFFPGTTSASSAAPVTIGVSEERSSLDMQLPLVPLARLTGTILREDGTPAGGTMVRLVDVDMPLPGFGVRVSGTGPDGRFTFDGVPPGRYRVRAQTGPANRMFIGEGGPGGGRVMFEFTNAIAVREGPADRAGLSVPLMPPATETRWASADVALTGGTAPPLSLVLRAGVRVAGRVAFDGTGQPPTDLSMFRVTLTSADAAEPGFSTSLATVDSDGRFEIDGVPPGSYRVTLVSPGGEWRPKSFVVNGRDALDFLLSIDGSQATTEGTLTLTMRPASLAGSIVDASGRPATGYTIVLFPDDPSFWTPGSRRIQAARPSTTGRFRLTDLPAGAYRLVAVDDLEEGRWTDPDLLRQLAGAALFLTIGDGENKIQDIRVKQ